jgi:hypothetical protein
MRAGRAPQASQDYSLGGKFSAFPTNFIYTGSSVGNYVSKVIPILVWREVPSEDGDQHDEQTAIRHSSIIASIYHYTVARARNETTGLLIVL